MHYSKKNKESLHCPICMNKHSIYNIYIQAGARLQKINETNLVFCDEKNEFFLFTENSYVSFSNDIKHITTNHKQLNLTS